MEAPNNDIGPMLFEPIKQLGHKEQVVANTKLAQHSYESGSVSIPPGFGPAPKWRCTETDVKLISSEVVIESEQSNEGGSQSDATIVEDTFDEAINT